MGKNQYVVNHKNGWAVQGENNKKATVVTRTQAEAKQIGRKIAQNQHSELRVQDKNGRFSVCNLKMLKIVR